MLPSEKVTIALSRPVSPLALSVVKPPMARFDAEIVFCDGLDGVVIVPPHALSENIATKTPSARSTTCMCTTQCKEHARRAYGQSVGFWHDVDFIGPTPISRMTPSSLPFAPSKWTVFLWCVTNVPAGMGYIVSLSYVLLELTHQVPEVT